MENNTILFFGGTGSLGYNFISKNINNNTIYNYSRDECKHWNIEKKFPKLKNIIGDIRDKEKVKYALNLIKPNIIIIASAMKHVDKCEYDTGECIKTNILGVQNIINSIIELENSIAFKNVIFISTDKACSPVNTYGMCKAISEKMISEAAYKSNNIKYNIVRYGNVLNSRGSIIPLLHSLGKNEDVKELTLTDVRMTRFIMTLDESCKLIEYAIEHGNNGETIVPEIISMYVKDLFEIFSELYNKKTLVTKLRSGEKLYESLINGTQYQLQYKKNGYYHIIPNFDGKLLTQEQVDLNSNMNIISKECLQDKLLKMGCLDVNYTDSF